MPKHSHKIGDFVFNGDSFGVIVDIILRAKKRYMVRWHDDTLAYAYGSGDIRMFKKIYEIEVGQDEA